MISERGGERESDARCVIRFIRDPKNGSEESVGVPFRKERCGNKLSSERESERRMKLNYTMNELERAREGG